uniref:Serine hydroxymethyltransferase 1 n=1 Tax=Lygus hesperus TaxID=30085 RepID=A0A0A9YC92_LYGHE
MALRRLLSSSLQNFSPALARVVERLASSLTGRTNVHLCSDKNYDTDLVHTGGVGHRKVREVGDLGGCGKSKAGLNTFMSSDMDEDGASLGLLRTPTTITPSTTGMWEEVELEC